MSKHFVCTIWWNFTKFHETNVIYVVNLHVVFDRISTLQALTTCHRYSFCIILWVQSNSRLVYWLGIRSIFDRLDDQKVCWETVLKSCPCFGPNKMVSFALIFLKTKYFPHPVMLAQVSLMTELSLYELGEVAELQEARASSSSSSSKTKSQSTAFKLLQSHLKTPRPSRRQVETRLSVS